MEWNEELFYVFNYDKPTGVCVGGGGVGGARRICCGM
jgi:hypothetical protein